MIVAYINFQIEVIQRRTQYELEKALSRAHLLEAFVTTLNDIDHAIELIKSSKNW